MKGSAPEFNIQSGVPLPPNLLCYDVPCFGPRITDAVMDIFYLPGMAECARRLGLGIPEYGINKVVQQKMDKALVVYTRSAQLGAPQEALTRLLGFIEAVRTLQPSGVSTREEWKRVVGQYVVREGWEDRLRFDELLSNFGIPDDIARTLQSEEYVTESESQPLTRYSFRWLCKAFECFGIAGTVCDVVNLIFAMMKRPPGRQERPALEEIVCVLKEFKVRLERADFADMWVPTHHLHDGEIDDTMAWLLLEFVHSLQVPKSKLGVLMQLPVHREFDAIKERIMVHEEVKERIQFFRDRDSKNMMAVSEYWDVAWRPGGKVKEGCKPQGGGKGKGRGKGKVRLHPKIIR